MIQAVFPIEKRRFVSHSGDFVIYFNQLIEFSELITVNNLVDTICGIEQVAY